MKTKPIIFLMALLMGSSTVANCQDFPVPVSYTLETKDDYARYNQEIISCVNWLESTPMNQEPEKRQAANRFLIQWITGSPHVTIELNANVIGFTKKNPELLALFLGGWTRYALQNNNSADVEKGTLAGIESVLKVYQAGNGLQKDKQLENLIKLQNNGKLEDWVKKQVKS